MLGASTLQQNVSRLPRPVRKAGELSEPKTKSLAFPSTHCRMASVEILHLLAKVHAFGCRKVLLDVLEPPAIPPIC